MKIGGKEIKPAYLIGGGAALVGGYIFWKRQASGAAAAGTAAASTSTASAIDPLTGLPVSQDNVTDPVTGMTYLQEAQEYGSVSAAEEAVSTGGSYGAYGQSGYGIDSGYPSSGYSGTTPSPTGTTYTTDSQWASAVQAGLVGVGYSATDIAAALGLYFAGHPVSSTQATILQVALAEYGPPPVGTYTIITSPSGPGPTGGGSIAGLKASAKFDNVTATWDAVCGATSYNVTVTDHQGAKQLASGTTAGTSYTARGLPQKTSIAVHVTAQPGGQTGVAYTTTQ